MPLDPRRVQAVFLAAADYHDRVDRAAILDGECSPRVRRAERPLERLGRIEDGWTQSALIVVSGRSRSFKEEETPSVPGADAPGPDLGETVSIFFDRFGSEWRVGR